MSQEQINVGSSPNDGTGDPARTAFTKVNNNATDAEDRLSDLEDGTVNPAAGSDTQVQYNKANSMAGDSGLVWDDTNKKLTITRSINDTLPVLSLKNTGTNPGETNIFTGDRNPDGIITAKSADLYIREGNGGTAIFINKGASPNTDSWCFLQERCAFGAGTQTANAIDTVINTQNVYETPAGSLTASGFEFNTTIGTMSITYNGPSTLSVDAVAWRFTADKVDAGAAENYEFRILKNGSQIGTSATQIIDDGDPQTVTLGSPIILMNGDVFTLQVRNLDGDSDILFTDSTFVLD